MPVKRQLTILVPGICGPLAETESLKSSPVIDRWIKFLSKSQYVSVTDTTNDVIASLFGLQVKGDFPSAVYTLLANDLFDASRFYMHADPVHLRADLEQAVLSSSADLNITQAESDALCDTLNAHFHQDGLHFFALNKDQWIVSSEKSYTINTTSLTDAVGRNINFILPKGKDAGHWKKILTEAQMLMHTHKVNENRESNGMITINSLWLHGSGEPFIFDHKEVKPEKINSVCSNHDTLKGLAKTGEYDYLKIPATVDDYKKYLLSGKHTTSNLLHMTDLENLVNYTDTRPWLNQLTETLDNWVYPLITFSLNNNFKLTLHAGNQKQYSFSKTDILKFWCNDELEEHVNSY